MEGAAPVSRASLDSKFSLRPKYRILPFSASHYCPCRRQFPAEAANFPLSSKAGALQSAVGRALRIQHLRQILHKMYSYTYIITYMPLHNFKQLGVLLNSFLLLSVSSSPACLQTRVFSEKKHQAQTLLCQTCVCLSFT